MANLTVRHVPEEVRRALRLRAAEHGRSTEAEVREILATAVMPAQRLRMGDALAGLGRELDLDDDDMAALQSVHTTEPAEPLELP